MTRAITTGDRARSDLSRWPPRLNLRGLSVAEGLRAALACALIIIANEILDWPPLLYAALAANLACSCDAGGALRQRVTCLLVFSCLGALLWPAFGLMRDQGPLLLLPVAGLVVFCDSAARLWGPGPQAVGNLLTVVLALSLDRPLRWAEAPGVAGMFLAGGLWATLLTGVIFRLNLHEPARAAVAAAWRALAVLAGDLHATYRGAPTATGEHWDSHARIHRRAVREAIEAARTAVLAVVRLRATLSGRGADAVLRLETAEQLFGSLIALSDRLGHLEREGEAPPDPATLRARRQALRRLRALIAVVAQAMARPFAGARRRGAAQRSFQPGRLEASIAALLDIAARDRATAPLFLALTDTLRVAVKLITSGEWAVPGPDMPPVAPWRVRVADGLRANLTWQSAILRHAVRTTVVFLPALLVTLARGGRLHPLAADHPGPDHAALFRGNLAAGAGTDRRDRGRRHHRRRAGLLHRRADDAGGPDVSAVRAGFLRPAGQFRRLYRLHHATGGGAVGPAQSRPQQLGNRGNAGAVHDPGRIAGGGGQSAAVA